MGILIIFIVLIIIAIILLKRYSPEIFLDQKSKALYNYKRKDFLMSRAEHEFFDILVDITKDQ